MCEEDSSQFPAESARNLPPVTPVPASMLPETPVEPVRALRPVDERCSNGRMEHRWNIETDASRERTAETHERFRRVPSRMGKKRETDPHRRHCPTHRSFSNNIVFSSSRTVIPPRQVAAKTPVSRSFRKCAANSLAEANWENPADDAWEGSSPRGKVRRGRSPCAWASK